MYIKIRDNKMPELILTNEQAQEKINKGEDLSLYVQMTDDEFKTYMKDFKKYQAEYEASDEYKTQILTVENQAQKEALQMQIDELDKKRVRAIAEPSIKDGATGQTWLDYYNEQIQELRTQIAKL